MSRQSVSTPPRVLWDAEALGGALSHVWRVSGPGTMGRAGTGVWEENKHVWGEACNV